MSETIIGEWLKNHDRDDLVIATKARFSTGKGVNDVGLSRKHIINSVNTSLKRLNTKYIDLFQLHCWDANTPLEESLKTVNNLVVNNKVRYIGISNFTSWQLQKAIDICHNMGLEMIISLQALYNLLDRYIEWDILKVCKNENLGLMCWSPLAGGWLAGKISRGISGPPNNSRVELAEKEGWSESWSNYNYEQTWNILDVLFDIARETENSPAQVAINWLLNHMDVTCPIIGARTIKQFEDNINSINWSLKKEQILRLNKISEIKEPRYPYGFINRFNP